MTEKQFKTITEWQVLTFPNATAMTQIEHLKEEIEELDWDVSVKNPEAKYEYADCLILIYGSAFRNGMSYDDIVKAINEKMNINHARKWGEAKENGVINHVR